MVGPSDVAMTRAHALIGSFKGIVNLGVAESVIAAALASTLFAVVLIDAFSVSNAR
jgi:hypothetical protein